MLVTESRTNHVRDAEPRSIDVKARLRVGSLKDGTDFAPTEVGTRTMSPAAPAHTAAACSAIASS